MDAVQDFLNAVRQHGLDRGAFLGLLNVVIGRRLQTSDGKVVSSGVTWRELSALLKKMRWEKDAVRELGLDPDAMPPRDRQRYWYSAITQANVDSATASTAGDQFAQAVQAIGYIVGAAPRR